MVRNLYVSKWLEKLLMRIDQGAQKYRLRSTDRVYFFLSYSRFWQDVRVRKIHKSILKKRWQKKFDK